MALQLTVFYTFINIGSLIELFAYEIIRYFDSFSIYYIKHIDETILYVYENVK